MRVCVGQDWQDRVCDIECCSFAFFSMTLGFSGHKALSTRLRYVCSFPVCGSLDKAAGQPSRQLTTSCSNMNRAPPTSTTANFSTACMPLALLYQQIEGMHRTSHHARQNDRQNLPANTLCINSSVAQANLHEVPIRVHKSATVQLRCTEH